MPEEQNNAQTAMVTHYEASPAYLINLLANHIALRAGRMLRRGFDLSVTEWRILGLAGAEPGATQQRAMDVSAVDRSVVSRGIQGLVKRGLIEVRYDPADARRIMLYLTASGQDVHDRSVVLVREGDEKLFSGFDPAERAALLGALRRMMENVPLMGLDK